MKVALTILLLGLLSSNGFSQNEITKELNEFIISQGNYVFLKDSANLPSIVNNYKPEIIKVIRKQNIRIKNALILIDKIEVDSNSIQVPVFDLIGFRKQFKMRTQKTEDGFPVMIIGNASGKDGVIVIYKMNKDRTEFLIYE